MTSDDTQGPLARASVDHHPWDHPFLAPDRIEAFRDYSEQVWELALRHQRKHPEPLRCAFSVNMAQNMYKWAQLVKDRGWDTTLFLHPMETCAINTPEWDEFDGEFPNVLDGAGFLQAHPDITVAIPVVRPTLDANDFCGSKQYFEQGTRRRFFEMLTAHPTVRHEVLFSYQGFYTYWD
jgi:hypothetical protein